MMHKDYHQVYDSHFFRRADGADYWKLSKLRHGDTLAAIGYALGLESFEVLREKFGFEGLGRHPGDDHRDAQEQLGILLRDCMDHPRQCRQVLDVGGGRGEVALSLAYLGRNVQMVEPHKDAEAWLTATHTLFFPGSALKTNLINAPVPECLSSLDLEFVDTVMFVESLEHIPEDCFDLFWPPVRWALAKNKGRLIVANWIDYHPLEAVNAEHCRRVDDALYEELAQGGVVKYRNGSHLVVDY